MQRDYTQFFANCYPVTPRRVYSAHTKDTHGVFNAVCQTYREQVPHGVAAPFVSCQNRALRVHACRGSTGKMKYYANSYVRSFERFAIIFGRTRVIVNLYPVSVFVVVTSSSRHARTSAASFDIPTTRAYLAICHEQNKLDFSIRALYGVSFGRVVRRPCVSLSNARTRSNL